MRAWWDSRSRREQVMLALLSVLLAVTVYWFGVIGPLASAERGARERLAQAVAAEAAIDPGLAELAELAALRRSARPPGATRPIATVAAETAAAAGLSLDRSEPDPGGGLRIGLKAVAPAQVFSWLAALQRGHGVAPSHLTVLKAEGGGLDVDATLVQAAP